MGGCEDGGAEYRDVEGHEGYRIGSDGSVWSCWRRVGPPQGFVLSDDWFRLKPGVNSGGYYDVMLRTTPGKRKTRAIHRLVALAFLGPPPPGHEVCHRDGNKLNNRAGNLYWGTRSDNMRDKYRHGYVHAGAKGEKSPRAKLTAGQVRGIRERLRNGEKAKALATEHGVSESTIRMLGWGRTWKEV
jgi:hypothetical protein